MIIVNNKKLYSISEVASLLNKPKKYVYNAIVHKQVLPTRLTETLYFTEDEMNNIPLKKRKYEKR